MASRNILLMFVAASLVMPAILAADCDQSSLLPQKYCACCDGNSTCLYQNNEFKCLCNPGFSGDGFTCADVNECYDDDTNTCDSTTLGGVCTNTPGSYNCGCADGFTSADGKGRVCKDINECTNGTHKCVSSTSTCANTNGEYKCDCRTPMYEQGPDDKTCIDVNECARNTSGCKYACENSIGNFTCKCNAGYSGDGVTCKDINECEKKPCHVDANCANTDGSYICECQTGLAGNGTYCTGFNECLQSDTNQCDGESTYCVDTARSYECKCFLGYDDQTRNRTHCQAKLSHTDIDAKLADNKRQNMLLSIRASQLLIARLEQEQFKAILNCKNKMELIRHQHRRRRHASNASSATNAELEQELNRLQITSTNLELDNRVIANRCATVSN